MIFAIFGGFFALIGFVSLLQVISHGNKRFWSFLTTVNGLLSVLFFAIHYFPQKALWFWPPIVFLFVIWLFLEKQRKEM